MDAWELHLRGGRPVAAVRRGPSGEILHRADALWTVRDLCRRSGKSRRQVYRDIQAGKVRPLGRFLGEWLLEPAALARLKPPPASLASLFPEHDLAALDLERSREDVLTRVLRSGGRDRLRWAFAYFGRAAVRSFVREKGPDRLDARSLVFWQIFFGLPRVSVSAVRAKGRRWGGGG